ncbi:MAG TPA: efflux RND transporter permease subunit, partial [Flavobacteriaceae bacterium]|nr:efflux RND transporter permease subunit [Flavobacteriaceae bacterium]
MGIIMAVGVSVSNAILVIDQAEIARKTLLKSAAESARFAVNARFRPILMTTLAMTAGMLPLALGLGEGGAQVAPLGQAVIGGLIFSTLTALLVLPFIYTTGFSNTGVKSVSLDPDDETSIYFEKSLKA